MSNKVTFAVSGSCEDKLLVLETNGPAGDYTLKSIDKGTDYQPGKGSIAKINEIAKILRDPSTQISADNSSIEAVAKRINAAKKKHNHSPIRRFLKFLLPKFILKALPFACVQKYLGVNVSDLMAKKKAANSQESKAASVLEKLEGEKIPKGSPEVIDLSIKALHGFSPLEYVSKHPEKSEEDLVKDLSTMIAVSEGMQKTFSPDEIKASFDETIEAVCTKYNITQEIVEMEAKLFGIDNDLAKLKMVKRLIVYLKAGLDPKENSPSLAKRQEATGFELSILKGIEKAFKKAVLGSDKPAIVPLKDSAFKVILSGKTVIVEEMTAGTGSFKIATFASDYFGMKSSKERDNYVTLKLKPPKEKKVPAKSESGDSSESPKGEEIAFPAKTHSSDKSLHTSLKTASENDFNDIVEVEGAGSVIIHESFGKRAPIPSFEPPEKSVSADWGSVIIHDSIGKAGPLPSLISSKESPYPSFGKSGEMGSFIVHSSPKRKPIPSFEPMTKEELHSLGNKSTGLGSFIVKDDSSAATDQQDSGQKAKRPSLKLDKKAIFAKFAKKKTPVPTYQPLKYDYDDPAHFESLPFAKWRTAALERELKRVQQLLSSEETLGAQLIKLKENEASLLKVIEERKQSKLEMDAYETPGEEEDFIQEIEATKLFQGPGVIELFSVIDLASGEKVMVQKAAGYKLKVKADGPNSEQETTVIDLKKLSKLQKKGKLDSAQKEQLLLMLDDAFQGVERMHSLGYIHRDLKPENILTTKEGRGALADFGTVCKVEGDVSKSRYYGTPRFSAPEVCAYSENDRWKTIDEKSDVWSAGMILMNCCFEGKSVAEHPAIKGKSNPLLIKEYFYEILNKPKERGIYEKKFPEPENKMSFEHLVWEATRLDPEKRPTIVEFRKKFNQIRQQMKA